MTIRSSRKVETLCRDFEQQRVCYLPLNIFLLRPLHRLLHYKLILERLCKHYPPTHDDFRDCRGTQSPTPTLSAHVCIFFLYMKINLSPPAALADISEMVLQLQGIMMKMENFQKLIELKKDLTGVEDLISPGRVRLFNNSASLDSSWTFVEFSLPCSAVLLSHCRCDSVSLTGVHQARLPQQTLWKGPSAEDVLPGETLCWFLLKKQSIYNTSKQSSSLFFFFFLSSLVIVWCTPVEAWLHPTSLRFTASCLSMAWRYIIKTHTQSSFFSLRKVFQIFKLFCFPSGSFYGNVTF